MELAHSSHSNILVITPKSDRLDAEQASQFKQSVIHLVDDLHLYWVVFDLKCLKFVDSSGLGSFLSVLRELNARGGSLKLSQMDKSVRTVFELVRMHRIFEIFNTTGEAIQSFK